MLDRCETLLSFKQHFAPSLDTVQTFQNIFSLSQSLDTASKLSNLYFIVKLTMKFGNFNLLFQKQNVPIAFYAKMNLFLKKKDGCLICVNKNSSPDLGLVWQNSSTSQFPKCTSKCTSSSLNLQVFAMSFTSEFTILQVHL